MTFNTFNKLLKDEKIKREREKICNYKKIDVKKLKECSKAKESLNT